jgi:hypothetical protein
MEQTMDICVYQCLSLLLNFGIFGVKTVSIIAETRLREMLCPLEKGGPSTVEHDEQDVIRDSFLPPLCPDMHPLHHLSIDSRPMSHRCRDHHAGVCQQAIKRCEANITSKSTPVDERRIIHGSPAAAPSDIFPRSKFTT